MIHKWPRYSELVLALWMIASAWVLEQPTPKGYVAVVLIAGAIVIMFDVLAITGRFRLAYLLILPVCAALLSFAFVRFPMQSQQSQNLVCIALLLAILAILPTEATQAPRSWREFLRRS